MKVLIIGNKKRYENYMPVNEFTDKIEKVYVSITADDKAILEAGKDADVICIDAISKLSANVIEQMSNLKLVHSDGVGFQGIDIHACKEKGIYVCNCRGANASPVAEHAIMLMMMLLKNAVAAHQEVYIGHQIQMKEEMIVNGIRELSDCKVGIVGFGAIGKEIAKRLYAYHCEVVYYDIFRNEENEKEYHVTYNDLDTLLKNCDIVSLHSPVTKDTKGMANDAFFKKMKKDAYLINTARGELVDNQALANAIYNEEIAGAALDTIAPEPVLEDHILLNLPEEVQDRLIFSPHIAGVTMSFFKRAQAMMWKNVEKVSAGDRPDFIVNGL